jgi:hypothetical protein
MHNAATVSCPRWLRDNEQQSDELLREIMCAWNLPSFGWPRLFFVTMLVTTRPSPKELSRWVSVVNTMVHGRIDASLSHARGCLTRRFESRPKKITNYLKATLAKRATVGPKRYRHDDAGCPERGRPYFFFVLDKDHLPT